MRPRLWVFSGYANSRKPIMMQNHACHRVCDRTRPRRQSGAAYALVGKLCNGASFLACGELDPATDQSSRFRLTFPKWTDVSQSSDSFRCPAASGHFVHLSASNPRRILNALSDYAILMTRSSEIHLGKLRIVHVTPVGGHAVVGCAIVTNARSSLDAVAMYVQTVVVMALPGHGGLGRQTAGYDAPSLAIPVNGCACLAVLRQTVPIHKCRVGLFHRRGLRPAPCLQTHQTSSFAAPGWPPSR